MRTRNYSTKLLSMLAGDLDVLVDLGSLATAWASIPDCTRNDRSCLPAPIEVVLDPLIINRDDIPKRTRCTLVHGGFFSLSWLRLATTSSARFGAASPTQLCETFCDFTTNRICGAAA